MLKFRVTGLRRLPGTETWSFRLESDPPDAAQMLGPLHIAVLGPRGGLKFARIYPAEWRREIARSFAIALARNVAERNGLADDWRESLEVLESMPLPEVRS